MTLAKYDEALEYKLKKVFSNVTRASDDSSLPQNAQEQEDLTVKLPLISFYRLDNPINLEGLANDTAIRRGRREVLNQQNVKMFPITINYQIDIWSNRRIEVDDIWRELLQYLYEEPELDVFFEGLDRYESFSLRFTESVNNSDTSSFGDKGRLYRQTVTIEIPQARLLFKEAHSRVLDIPVRLVDLKTNEELGLIEVKGDTNG